MGRLSQRIWPLAAALAVGLAVSEAAVAQDEQEPEFDGGKVYELFCIVCHGPKGEGSPLGSNLVEPSVAAKSDAQLIELISKGRPDKGMMGFEGKLSEEEIFGSLEYMRELQGKTVEKRTKSRETQGDAVRGSKVDARQGEALFNGKAGCIRCHSYSSRGGVIGPELDELADRLTPEGIRDAVNDPSKSQVRGFRGFAIVTKDGRIIRGRGRNNTRETLQLQNAEGNLWTTYFRKDLESVKALSESLMPADLLSRLDENEKAALFTFLETLK